MIGRGKGDVKIYEGVREKYTDNIFGENDIDTPKLRKKIVQFSKIGIAILDFSLLLNVSYRP